MNKNDSWKEIPWYEWFYIASTAGEIRSVDRFIKHWQWGKSFKQWKILILNKRPTWYLYVDLLKEWQKRSCWVHRLICSTFHWLDINNTKLYACHKNDIRDDNRSKNLFIWTAQDNTNDCIMKWRDKYKNTTSLKKWEKHKLSILKDNDVLEIRELLSQWIPQKEIAKRFNVDASNISKIKNWKRWSHI